MHDRDYEKLVFGPAVRIDFTTAAIRIRLCTPNQNGTTRRRSFDIRVTANCRILQGNSSVTAIRYIASPAQAPNCQLVQSTERWRCDVKDDTDAFISVVGETASGSIEITKKSEISTADAVTQV